MKPAQGKRVGCLGRARAGCRGLWTELCILHRHPVFLAVCYGYVPVQAVLGTFTFWGPKVRLQRRWLLCSRSSGAMEKIARAHSSPVRSPFSFARHYINSLLQVGRDTFKRVSWCMLGTLQAAKAILNSQDDTISFLLGGITVGTAVVGTLGGGTAMHPSLCTSSQPGHFRTINVTVGSCPKALPLGVCG